MADRNGPIATANRMAMSRALGAAFLNHQVEQLEKTVNARNPSGPWRDRRYPSPQLNADSMRGPPAKHSSTRPRNPSEPVIKLAKKGDNDFPELVKKGDPLKKENLKTEKEKDADVIVVDASVLIYALGQLKKWCKDGRDEVLIVPLEALNTLDLLKKGTSALAQRARTASRILEAQVGVNPRIRVQRDDAFVLWDEIPFKDLPSGVTAPSCPEWVRRTICCAKWEAKHVSEEVRKSATGPDSSEHRVVLAVLSAPPEPGSLELQSAHTTLSPVPLPAPQVNKYEPRCSGALISQWSSRASVDVLGVAATPIPPPTAKDSSTPSRHSADQGRRSGEHGGGGRRSPEDKRPPPGRARKNSHRPSERGPTPPGGGLVERPPAVMAMMEAIAQPSKVVRVLARGEKLDP